jgi:acetyl-CoA carboxylase carboxyltransferase component
MSDEAIIVGKQEASLAGSYLSKQPLAKASTMNLGRSNHHCEISGVTDYKAKDDKI